MGFAIGYLVILSVLAVFAFFFALKAFLKKDIVGILLCIACVLTFAATITYLVSAFTTKLNVANITANLYFTSISLILAVFVLLNTYFTKRKLTKIRLSIFAIILAYALYEVVAFALNIKFGFMVKIKPVETTIPPYFVYDMKVGFYLHLAFSYIVIAIIFFQLLAIIIKTPIGYRRTYTSVLVTLLIVVLVNAAFLFFSNNINDQSFTRFDISLLGYFAIIIMIYWAQYSFAQNGLVTIYKNFIMNNVEQGFVLFSYERRLIYINENAKKMLIGINLKEGMTIRELVVQLGLEPERKVTKKSTTSQITIKNGNDRKTLRLTSRALFSKKDVPIGFLFTFNNTEYESDVLTSFESLNAFKAKAKQEGNFFFNDMVLSVLDINNLGAINTNSGYAEGDVAIQDLSNLMRKHFPKNSYFVRGREASLLVFAEGIEENDAMEICELINKESKYPIQYSVTYIEEKENLTNAVERALESLNTRKVMDPKSRRSNSLNSLIRALQEVDSDTSSHVKRTQIMADKLATQLGLSQVEKNNLLLLSILHDIGKISIPLEILNKPTKLTDDEWKVLKTHTVKGYNIAMSAPLLSGIADEILHHHERWDGRGYPDGLAGDNIPLLSRIVSVVDSYDAMVSDRPYRNGMSTSAAIEELIRCSGTQFDPNIVKEFVAILEADNVVYAHKKESFVEEKKQEVTVTEIENVIPLSFSRYTVANQNDIVFADAYFERITGYTQEDINKGLTQLDLIPEEDRAGYANIVKRIMGSTSIAVIEHRIQKKDGTIISVLCYGKKYFDSAVREFRDEIMISDTANVKSIKGFDFVGKK